MFHKFFKSKKETKEKVSNDWAELGCLSKSDYERSLVSFGSYISMSSGGLTYPESCMSSGSIDCLSRPMIDTRNQGKVERYEYRKSHVVNKVSNSKTCMGCGAVIQDSICRYCGNKHIVSLRIM